MKKTVAAVSPGGLTRGEPPATSSREVSCCAVYLHVAPTLMEVGDWPLVGTPAWAVLDDDDPRKQAAVLHAALQWVLQQDIEQEAERAASHAVSASENWRAIGNAIQRRKEFYAGKPWLKRRTA